MATRLGFAGLLLGMAITASASSAVASAASPTDACLLLSQAKISDAVGSAVASGTHVTTSYLQTCTWNSAAHATKGLKAVTLHFDSATQFEAGKQLVEASQARTKEVVFTAVSGVGDDAYFVTFGSSATSFMFKKGNYSFKIAIYGELPPGQALAASKALAAEVLSKL